MAETEQEQIEEQKIEYDYTLPIKRVKQGQNHFPSDGFCMNLDECLEYTKSNEIPLMAIYLDEDYRDRNFQKRKESLIDYLSSDVFVQFREQNQPLVVCIVDSNDTNSKSSNLCGEWQLWTSNLEKNPKNVGTTVYYKSPQTRTVYYKDQTLVYDRCYPINDVLESSKFENVLYDTVLYEATIQKYGDYIVQYFGELKQICDKYPNYVPNRVEKVNGIKERVIDETFVECGRYTQDLTAVQNYAKEHGTLYQLIFTGGSGNCGGCTDIDRKLYSKKAFQLLNKEYDIPTAANTWYVAESQTKESNSLLKEILGRKYSPFTIGKVNPNGHLRIFLLNQETGNDKKQLYLGCALDTKPTTKYRDSEFGCDVYSDIGKLEDDTLNILAERCDYYQPYTGSHSMYLSWMQQHIVQKPILEYQEYTFDSTVDKKKKITTKRRVPTNVINEFQVDDVGSEAVVRGLWDGNGKSYGKITLSKKICYVYNYLKTKIISRQRTEVKYQWRIVTGIESGKTYELGMLNYESDFDEVYFCAFFDRTKAEKYDMDSDGIIDNADIRKKLIVGTKSYTFTTGNQVQDGKMYICFTRRDVGYMKTCKILFNYTLQATGKIATNPIISTKCFGIGHDCNVITNDGCVYVYKSDVNKVVRKN